jgi:methionine-R-sulfoxide reductase
VAAVYEVLRRDSTEIPFSSKPDFETWAGTYACVGCDLPVFSSATKYDSHTGWPSFWQPLAHAVAENDDTSLGMDRTEVHCVRCGGTIFWHVLNCQKDYVFACPSLVARKRRSLELRAGMPRQ